MVYVRQTIVSDASLAMSRAVCIATRYSAVRRQFGSKQGSLETQVSCKVVTGICILPICSLLLQHAYFINKCNWDFSIFLFHKSEYVEGNTI